MSRRPLELMTDEEVDEMMLNVEYNEEVEAYMQEYDDEIDNMLNDMYATARDNAIIAANNVISLIVDYEKC